MSIHIVADLQVCQGYANCVVAASDVFDLGDDGKVRVLDVDLGTVDRDRLEEAVASCPTGALTLETGSQ